MKKVILAIMMVSALGSAAQAGIWDDIKHGLEDAGRAMDHAGKVVGDAFDKTDTTDNYDPDEHK